MIGLFRTFEEQDGISVVLLDPYADAIGRYGLEGWRVGDEFPTVGEAIGQARSHYQEVIEAMAAFTLNGGRDQWGAFEQALIAFVPAAGLAVVVAQRALRESGTGFSEYTDPAFAGLVEADDQ